jgi:hypothetical protein
MLNARPHINGNTPEHFAEAYVAVNDALMAVQKAREAVMANVVNGRNYQHLGAGAFDMQQFDANRIKDDFYRLQRLLGDLGSDIVNAHLDHAV